MIGPVGEVLALVGREVVMTFAYRPTVQAVGVLLDATDDGEVRYRNAEGLIRRAWPLLDIELRRPDLVGDCRP